MDDSSFKRIIFLVEEKLGLKRQSISLLIWKDRIQERMIACQRNTYEEYEQLLISSTEEMQKLIVLIVNLETWFFREQAAFDYLTHFIQQTHSQNPYFKILSLACSTGEEPYSIAMTCFDAGLSKNDFRIEALDISQNALHKARIGVYGNNSFRSHDLNFRDRYFIFTKAGYVIKNQIKKQIDFYESNILEEHNLFNFQSYHVIFCRHLLIYLKPQVQLKLLNEIKKQLDPQGILFVGAAETKIALRAGFESILTSHTAAFKLKNKKNFLIKQQEKQTQTFPHPFPDWESLIILSTSGQEDSKLRILNVALERANEGDFEEARQLCLYFLYNYGVNADIYYLLGLLNHATGDIENAKHDFQKAIYLRPSHYEALMCLALLYENQGEKKQAQILRKRALKYYHSK